VTAALAKNAITPQGGLFATPSDLMLAQESKIADG
jgi:hypothetical protein